MLYIRFFRIKQQYCRVEPLSTSQTLRVDMQLGEGSVYIPLFHNFQQLSSFTYEHKIPECVAYSYFWSFCPKPAPLIHGYPFFNRRFLDILDQQFEALEQVVVEEVKAINMFSQLERSRKKAQDYYENVNKRAAEKQRELDEIKKEQLRDKQKAFQGRKESQKSNAQFYKQLR